MDSECREDLQSKESEQSVPESIDSRAEVRNRTRLVKYRVLGILIGTLLFSSAGLIRALDPWVVPYVMEQKYQDEFEYKGRIKSEIVVVSPSDEPDREVLVKVEGKAPWAMKYIDNYKSDVAEEYVIDYLKRLVHSDYASRVFIDAENDAFDDYRWMEWEKDYTLQEVKLGPTVAPEVFRTTEILIHFYGPPEEREKMIEEMFYIYRTIQTDYSGTVNCRMAVVDEAFLEKNESLEKLYSSNGDKRYNYMELNNHLWDIQQNNIRDVWKVTSSDFHSSRERLFNDLSYFKVADVELFNQAKRMSEGQ